MQSKKTLLISIVVIVLVGAGLVLASIHKKQAATTANNSSASSADMSKSNSASSSKSSTATATTAVTIQDYAFGPATIKVKTGDTVTWTNNDAVQHSIVADTASADAPNGPLFGKGETYTYTFKKAGTYTYHCGPHPYMHGSVVVSD